MNSAVQNSERMLCGLGVGLIMLIFLIGCSSNEDERAEGPKPADCNTFVRAALEQVDLQPNGTAKDSVIMHALAELGAEPSPNCEWPLLWERIELDSTGSTNEQVIRTGNRLLTMERYLSTDQRVRLKFKLAEAYFALGIPKSFDLAKDVFLARDSLSNSSNMMFRITSLLVNTYDLTGELEECAGLLRGALEKAQQQGDPLWTVELIDRLGDLYLRQGKYDEALAVFQDGITLLDALEYRGAARDTLLERIPPAQQVSGSATDPNAVALAPRMLTIRDQLLLRQRIRRQMGDAYAQLGALEKAQDAYGEALTLTTGPLVGMVEAPYVELGELGLKLGNPSQANEQGQLGLAQARKLNDPEGIRDAATLLYKANKQQGNLSSALAMYELAKQFADSVGGTTFALALQKKQVQYEVRDDSLQQAEALGREQLERRNAQLEAQSNKTMAFAATGVGVLLLAGSGAWFLTDRRRRRERFDRESAQLETQALRSQMNPHFIFNALNSINAYVQENDQDMASSYLIKFARVMRAVLENSRQTEVQLSEDLDALRGYMELERMRLQGKFDFSIEVAPDLDPEEVMVPPLVVQPFVENAIWHGMSAKEGKGHITLKVERREGQLVWTIEDDGVGRKGTRPPDPAPEAPKSEGAAKKTSLGTAITRARLDLVQKQHGGKAGFRYIDLAVGTRVEVDMPLRLDA